MTISSLLALKEAATAAPWRPLQAGIRAIRGWSRGKSWQGTAELQQALEFAAAKP